MRKFQRRTEDFDCLHCGRSVRGDGYTNHCPECLTSRHVDINPGDRAADCHGLMFPVRAAHDGKKGITILFRCSVCGHEGWNRSSPSDNIDELAGLLAIPE